MEATELYSLLAAFRDWRLDLPRKKATQSPPTINRGCGNFPGFSFKDNDSLSFPALSPCKGCPFPSLSFALSSDVLLLNYSCCLLPAAQCRHPMLGRRRENEYFSRLNSSISFHQRNLLSACLGTALCEALQKGRETDTRGFSGIVHNAHRGYLVASLSHQ